MPLGAESCGVEQQIFILHSRQDDHRRRLRRIEASEQRQSAFTRREHQIEHEHIRRVGHHRLVPFLDRAASRQDLEVGSRREELFQPAQHERMIVDEHNFY